eukprot:7744589-Karenia_brevis.AAC.1
MGVFERDPSEESDEEEPPEMVESEEEECWEEVVAWETVYEEPEGFRTLMGEREECGKSRR